MSAITMAPGPAATRREAHQAFARDAGMGVTDWPSLGTTAHLVVTDASMLDVARETALRVLADVDRTASRFRPDSELSQLNIAGGHWVSISPLFAQLLSVAIDAAEATSGLVDPTVGASLIDQGYDRTFALVAPTGPPLVGPVRTVPGWHSIELQSDAARARVAPGTVVDLGATAKGVAADMCAAAVAQVAGCGTLISLGGDIAVAGEGPDGGWPVLVSDSSDLSLLSDAESSQVVVISSGGLATSSVTARRWRRGGSVIHHLIDPRTASPAAGPWRTASVVASSCALANTVSTAAIIAGDVAPGWLAAQGFHARLVTTDGAIRYVGDWPHADDEAGLR